MKHFNGNKNNNVTDAKVTNFRMFKVKKQWIFASAVMLSMLGAGMAGTYEAKADTVDTETTTTVTQAKNQNSAATSATSSAATSESTSTPPSSSAPVSKTDSSATSSAAPVAKETPSSSSVSDSAQSSASDAKTVSQKSDASSSATQAESSATPNEMKSSASPTTNSSSASNPNSTASSNASSASSSSATTETSSAASSASSKAPDTNLSSAADQIKDTTSTSNAALNDAKSTAKNETITKAADQTKKTDTNKKNKNTTKLPDYLEAIAKKYPNLRASLELFATGSLAASGTAADGLDKNSDGTYRGILTLIYQGTSISIQANEGVDFVIQVPVELQELFATPEFSKYISGGFEFNVDFLWGGSYTYKQSDIEVASDGSQVTFKNANQNFVAGVKFVTVTININLGQAVTDTGLVIDESNDNYTFNSALIQHGSFIDWNLLGNYGAETQLQTNDLMPDAHAGLNKPFVSQPVTDTDTNVIGTGVPGATITIYNGDRSQKLGQGTVNDQGFYKVTIPSQDAGTTINVTQTVNGKESDATAVIIQHAPVVLKDPTITSGYTGDTVVNGNGNKAGDLIVIKDADGRVLGQDYVKTDGTFSVKISRPLVEGETITAQETNGRDQSGDSPYVVATQNQIDDPQVNDVYVGDKFVSGKGQNYNDKITVTDVLTGKVLGTAFVQEDGSFYVPISGTLTFGQILRVTESDPNGHDKPGNTNVQVKQHVPSVPSIKGDVYTNTTVITGTADPNTDITIKVGGNVIGSGRTDAQGNYSITIAPQKSGTVIEVTSTLNGVESQAARTSVKIPAPTAEAPQAGARTITGKGSEANNTIKIYDATGKQIGIGLVSDDGSFIATTTRALVAGEKLTIVEVNTDNNTNSDPGSVTVQEAPVHIGTPSVNDATAGDTTITGQGQTEGNTITVTDANGNTIGTGSVGAGGKIEVNLNRPLVVGEKVNVVESDKAGNKSDPATVTVKDQEGIPAPQNTNASSFSGTVTGKGSKPGNTIIVKDADGNELGRGTIDKSGSFTIDGLTLNPGDTIYVTETDGTNTSPAAEVIVEE
ncbi:Ig-like domain-containing protein [Pediococcus stilesii]|nr:Ig-like domain-containing protein [Pediococcus stilesii]